MKDVESRSKCKVRNAMKIKNRKMALIDNFVFPVVPRPKEQNRHLTYPQAINHHIYKTIQVSGAGICLRS